MDEIIQSYQGVEIPDTDKLETSILGVVRVKLNSILEFYPWLLI